MPSLVSCLLENNKNDVLVIPNSLQILPMIHVDAVY